MDQQLDLGFVIGTGFIMLSLGLGLSLSSFLEVISRPLAFTVGLVFQVMVLPVTALLLVTLWPVPLPPEIAIGTMFLAAAPGGVTSNLLTRFAGGDTALSISLTAATTLGSALTVPIVVTLSLAHFGVPAKNVPGLWSVSLTLFCVVVLPVCAGLALRHYKEAIALRIEPLLRRISLLLLAVLLTLALVEGSARFLEHSVQAVLVALALNLVMMIFAALGARLSRVGRRQAIALSLECGLQSTPLAIALLLLLGFSREHIVPAAFYGAIMLITASALTAFLAASEPKAEYQG